MGRANQVDVLLNIKGKLEGKEALQEAKVLEGKLTNILEKVWDSSDGGASYFKEFASMMHLMERRIKSFKDEYGDAFDHVFNGLDSGMQKTMEELFQTTKKELTAVDELERRVVAAQKKMPKGAFSKLDKADQEAYIAEANKLHDEVKQIYAALGAEVPVDISEKLLPPEKLKRLKTALSSFASLWEDVNDRVAKGLGFGGSGGSGKGALGTNVITQELDELARETKAGVEKLDKEIHNLKRKKEELDDVLAKTSPKALGSYEVDLDVDSVKKLVDEYRELEAVIKNGDKDLDTYHAAMIKIVSVTAKLAAVRKKLYDKNTDPEILKRFRDEDTTPEELKKEGSSVHHTLAGDVGSIGGTIKGEKNYNYYREKATNRSGTYGNAVKAQEAELKSLQNAEQQIAKNKELGWSYKKLAKYAVEYFDTVNKENFTDLDKNKLGTLEKDLKQFAKDKNLKQDALKDVFDSAYEGDFADEDEMLHKLCNVLGVQIPANAQKAREALKSVDAAASGVGTGTGTGTGDGSGKGDGQGGAGVSDEALSSLEGIIKGAAESLEGKLENLDFSKLSQTISSEAGNISSSIETASSNIVAAIKAGDDEAPITKEKENEFSEMDSKDAMKLLEDRIGSDVLKNWYDNQDHNAKKVIEDTIRSDKSLLNAAYNVAWEGYKKQSGQDIGFNEFLNTEIPMYRGKKKRGNFDVNDYISFTPFEEVAKQFGDVVKTMVKPIDTLGSASLKNENEFFVSREQIESRAEVQDWLKSLDNKTNAQIEQRAQEAAAFLKNNAPEDQVRQALERSGAQDIDKIIAKAKELNGVVESIGDSSNTAAAVAQQDKIESALEDTEAQARETAKAVASVGDGDNKKLQSYQTLTSQAEELVSLKKIIKSGNQFLLPDYYNGHLQSSSYVHGSDIRQNKATKTSVRRNLDKYTEYIKRQADATSDQDRKWYADDAANYLDKITAGVATYNNLDDIKGVFKNSELEIWDQVIDKIEKAKAAKEAYDRHDTLGRAMLYRSGQLGDEDTKFTLADLDQLNSFDDPQKALDYLVEKFNIEIPQAANKAEAAVESVTSELKQLDQQKTQLDHTDSTPDPSIQKETADIEEQTEAYHKLENAKKEADNKTPDTNISGETQELGTLQEKVDAVTGAVKLKTEAFEAEKTTVSNVVDAESRSLLELLHALQDVIDKVENVDRAFKGLGDNSINDIVTKIDAIKSGLQGVDTAIDDIDSQSKDVNNKTDVSKGIDVDSATAQKGYALESTLGDTNTILGNILAAIKGDDESETGAMPKLISSLAGAVDELKSVASGIVQQQRLAKSDTSVAQSRISDKASYGQLRDVALNSLGNRAVDSDVTKMTAMANGVVKVEGWLKTAENAWEGFTVQVNEAYEASKLAFDANAKAAQQAKIDAEALAKKNENPYEYNKAEVEARAKAHLDAETEKGNKATVQFKDSGRYTITVLEEIGGLSKQVFQTFDENDKKIERTTATMSNATKMKIQDLQRLVDTSKQDNLVTDNDMAYSKYAEASAELERMNQLYKNNENLSREEILNWNAQIKLVERLGGDVTKLINKRKIASTDEVFLSRRNAGKNTFDFEYAKLQKSINIPDSFISRINKAGNAIKNAVDSEALSVAQNDWKALRKEIEKTALEQDLYIKKAKKAESVKIDDHDKFLDEHQQRYNRYDYDISEYASSGINTDKLRADLAIYENALNRVRQAKVLLDKASTPDAITHANAAWRSAAEACAVYERNLKKVFDVNQKFETSRSDTRPVLQDAYDLTDMQQKKQALIDYVEAVYKGQAKIGQFDQALEALNFTIKDTEGHVRDMNAAFNAAETAIGTTVGKAKKETGILGSIFGGIGKEFTKLFRYFTARFGIEEVFQAFRTGVQYVRDIDNALTDLKKVTNETDAGYERFLQTMSKTAGIVGSTVAELTTMAAEWARLGYSMSEAAGLAESTAVLLNVSEFEDATEASQALISTIQAFGYAAEESMDVVDIMNEIGNNYAVSSDGIATALQDSASALMAGGNSMEEATAMIAAANKVVQDPSQVGSGLRTISLRLRGTEVSGQLEELGEDASGLVSSSKMRDKIKGLSGVDILTDTGAYKSTYQIISEIAAEWENMNDMDQAALLELMAGKNRSNIMAALLTNAKDLEGAYKDALDAEGSAYRENEAYLDSIQGRVDLFINALQTFWMNLINSDTAKAVVDFGTSFIEFLDTAHGKLITVGAGLGIFLKATNKIDGIKDIFSAMSGVNIPQSTSSKVAGMATGAATSAKAFTVEFASAMSQNANKLGIFEAVTANVSDSKSRREINKAVASALDGVDIYADLSASQKKQALQAMESAAATQNLSKAQTTAMVSASGLSKGTTAMTLATNGAKGAMGGLLNVMKAHPFLAVVSAALLLAAAFDKVTKTAQEASEASTDKFNDISDVFGTTKSNINDIEDELDTINTQIDKLEGGNLSFTDAQELQRLKDQRSALESNLDIQNDLLAAQEKIKNEAAVKAMKDFVKASNEGAESASKTGKAVGILAGGLLAVGGIAAAVFTGGLSLSASAAGIAQVAGVVAGGAILGGAGGEYVGSKTNAATVSTYEDWYKTYTDAYAEKTKAANDAREKYEKDADNMEKYDHWQKLEQEALDVQSKMYDNLTQMQNYYDGMEYGQSDALDRELDAWNNFLDKMNIDTLDGVAKSGAKVNALDRIFGENASDEVKAFKEEVNKALDDDNTKFDIAAEIEGREDLQELENQLAEIGITTDEVSDYFRKTGEIGTEAFSDLSGEITAAKTAMTQLQTALEKNTNEGYETRNTGLEEMKDLMERGAIGSESNLWNVAEAMGFTYDSAKSIEANADRLYDFIKVRDDWYQVDDDGNWGVAGADAFAEDIENAVANSKELQKLDIKWKFDESTGTLDFDFNNMQFDEIVAALGRTKEAAGLTNEEFIDMLTHLGQFYNVQWASGNDIVSYLDSLKTAGASAKDQLSAIEEPLRHLLSQKGIDPKQIEKYLTGDGSLKQLPADLQKAVGAYRELRKEMEKPVEDKTTTSATKKDKTFGEKIKDLFSGDKDKKETVQKDVDVEVKADEVDTTDVDNKTEEAIKTDDTTKTPTIDKTVEVEATLEEISQSIQDIEDKDITIDVTVKGLKDVEKLNKNLDLDSKVRGNTDKLSEYVKGAKALSKLDNNIESDVTANVHGNVTDLLMFEERLDNLKVFSDSAKDLNKVGNVEANVVANVEGNVLDEFEFRINNLKELSDSAKDLDKIGDVESWVRADVTGNVIETPEYMINNLKEFSDSTKDLKEIGSFSSEITANVNGNVTTTPEFLINNLKTFADSAKGLDDVGSVTSSVVANIEGNVIDTPEFVINNLKTFYDSAKDLGKLGYITSNVTANVDGNVIGKYGYMLERLKTFSDSAKDLKNIGFVKSDVTAEVKGNVIDTFEFKLNNLETFTDSAEDLRKIGTVSSMVTANISGNVVDTAEYRINNLKTFIDSAEGLSELKDNIDKTVTANINGNVVGTPEAWINNLKTFSNSALGLLELKDNIEKTVKANIDGNVIYTPEAWINNLKTFSDSAVGLSNLEDNIEKTIVANIEGNVKNTLESSIDNLKVFTDSAAQIKSLDKNTEAKVAANLEGNIKNIPEGWIDNLGTFVDSATGISEIGQDVRASVTANIGGNVTNIDEGKIKNLDTFVDAATSLKDLPDQTSVTVYTKLDAQLGEKKDIKDLAQFAAEAVKLNGLDENISVTLTASLDGNALEESSEDKLDNLKTFAENVKDLTNKGEIKADIYANIDGNVFEIDASKLSNLKTFAESIADFESKGDEPLTAEVIARIAGNILEIDPTRIENIKTFADAAQTLDGVESSNITTRAVVEGNLDEWQGKLGDLVQFAETAASLNSIQTDNGTVNVAVKASAECDLDEGLTTKLENFASVVSELSSVTSPNISVTLNIDSQAITDAINLLTTVRDSGVFGSYTASVTVTTNTTQVNTAVQNINALVLNDKELKISETGSSTVLNALDSINNKKLNNKTVYVNYQTGTMPSIPSWPGGRDGNTESPWPLVNGTAHAKGTAWAGGNWGAPCTTTALTGELGPEIVVRGSRWFTVGENGAEFAKIQKGDIIFNHKQSEELLKNGYVTSGGGRAKAYAQGTAWASGNSKRKTYTFSYSDNSSSSSSSNGSVKKSTKSKKKKNTSDIEVFDWVEVKLEEINEQLDLMEAKLSNIAKANRGATFDKMLVTSNRELNTLTKGLKVYESYANSLLKKIPKKYRAEAKNGKLAIEEFAGSADKKTLEAIQNYREWAQKVADLKQQFQEVKAEIRALAKEKIDNIADLWDNRKEIWDEGIQTRVQTHIDLTEESGNIASAVSYKELARQEEQMIGRDEKKLAAMQAELDLQVKNNNIQRGTDEWYEAVAAIQAVQAEIDEGYLNLEKYQNAINQIHWDTFDEVLNRFSYAKDEIQSLIDLIDEKDAFNVPDSEGGWRAEDVTWSDEGIAKQALYLEQMEIAKKEQEEYAKQIEYLEANKENYSESEYQEKMAELTQGLYDSQDAYQAAEDGLVNLEEARINYIKEGIEKEIKALEELTEKKKEELAAEKDLYDFQRGVMNQQKDIADLERKLAALAGDNSASAQAKRRQLEAQLAEAKQELEDTYYDRSVSDQQDALDKHLETFQKAREKEIEDLEKSLENVEQIVADATNQVVANGNRIASILEEIAKKNGIVTTSGDAAVSDDVTSGASSTDTTAVDDVSSDVDAETQAGDQDATTNNNEIIEDTEDSYETYAINKGDMVNAKGAKIYKSMNSKHKKPNYNKSYTQRKEYQKDPKFKVLDFWQGDKFKWAKVRWHKKLNGKTAPIRWFKVKDLTDVNQYAKGSKGIKKDQLAWVDELGPELQIVPNGQGRLEYLKKGTGVVPADLTANLMEWGKLDPTSMIDQNRPSVGASPSVHATEVNLNIQYGDMLKIENFKGDNPDEIAKIVAKQFEKHTKDLNSALRKYVR